MTDEPGVPRAFTVLGPLPQFEPVVSERTWHSEDSSGHWLETRVRDKSSGELAVGAGPRPRRLGHGVDAIVVVGSRAGGVRARRGTGARIAIRNREPLQGLVETPDGRVSQRLNLEPTTDTPTTIELPAAQHLMVSLWRRPW